MAKRTRKLSGLRGVIILIATLIIGFLAGWQIDINVFRPDTTETVEKTVEITVDSGSSIELGDTDEPALVEESVVPLIDQKDIKTVESVDGGQIQTEAGEALDDVSGAQGAFYRTDTFQNFIADTENKCVIEGNIYGAQCVSLAQAFWTNYAGRSVSVCGTGAAYGIWQCAAYNAGNDFELIYTATDIQAGDWVITSGGTWGHVAMAVGSYNNGYAAVYGENQGGTVCQEGGSQPNVVNLSMRTFLGAFRPKAYIIAEPEPEVPDSGATK